jgi:SMC interacting uncharacterized protein involved in chromosome segregation
MNESIESIITALIGIIPTVVVAVFSIISNNQVITTKIDSLKEQVEKHNKVIERVYKLEGEVETLKKELEK